MSITGYENRITKWLANRDITASRRYIKKIAAMIERRQVSMSNEDLERVFMHADPTPPKAFRNICEAGGGAAQRLGLTSINGT